MSLKRRAALGGAWIVASLAGGAPACGAGGAPLVSDDVPRDRAATFYAFGRGQPLEPVSGPAARWTSAADDPAHVEVTPEGLRLTSLPGRRAWAVPRLPVAALDAIPESQIEDATWEAAIGLTQRYFIVCELRFAGESGAVLIQATPYDLQIFQDADRPAAAAEAPGGRSESVSRVVDDAREHYWRLRLAGGRLDLRLDGTTIWSLPGPRALARLAFGETRTDDGHGGSMLLRDLVYVRRPA